MVGVKTANVDGHVVSKSSMPLRYVSLCEKINLSEFSEGLSIAASRMFYLYRLGHQKAESRRVAQSLKNTIRLLSLSISST